MDVEEIREGVLAILKELHEDIDFEAEDKMVEDKICLLYTSPSPRDRSVSRMPSSA